MFLFIMGNLVDMSHVYGELKQVRNGAGEVIKRKHLWMDSVWIIAMFPLTGIGFGAFKNMYPAYTSIPVSVKNRSQGVKHAHNEAIELLADGGLIAFLLKGWFVIVVLLKSFRAYRKRKELFSISLFLGGITGIGGAFLYGMLESNLHMGGNGLYFYLLCGLIISASHTRLRSHLEPTKLGKSKYSVRKRLAVPAFSTLAACLIFNAFMIFNPGALVEKSWASSNNATWIQVDGETYGAQADQRGPIGGGRGYKGIVTTGDFVVENLDQLLDAIAKAKAGQVIFIPGEVEIDCTARVYIEQLVLEIPGGVTLASNRGDKESKGALIYSDALKTPVLIRPMGPNVRITGLRIRGPNPKRYMEHHRRSSAEGRGDKYYYKFPTSIGIQMEHPGLEVDNCEISGFGHAGIYLLKGDRHHIHHCFIHHCQYNGLGYGVTHNIASSLIEQNLFDFNRHSIAGTGRPGCSYEARHNVQLGTSYNHCFDMHGGRDRKDGTDIAGTRILIHHNTFRAPDFAVKIRGVPQDVCRVFNNWFPRHMNPQDAVHAYKNTQVQDNAYGTLPVRVIK